MKILSILLISLCAFSTISSAGIRELPPIKGSPQILTNQNVGLMSTFRTLSKSQNIADKQMLIDCIEYSFDPYNSDEIMTLEERIPALGLAENTMGNLEVPLIVFSILESENQVIKNRLALLLFKVTNGQPATYLKKMEISKDNDLAKVFGDAETASQLEEMAFFEDFTENQKILDFLKRLDNQE